MEQKVVEQLYRFYQQHPVVSTDTRNLPQNAIFFALKGGNFNGNKFAATALEKGAALVVIDEEEYALDNGTFLVDNVLEALQELAKYHRQQLTIPIIGITGSNGKTTTKELMREVLAKRYKIHATTGNLNNHIGVPLTLLSIDHGHEMAIIEMGANHLKEIGFLCSIADPDYGIITNIGKAHIEGFGSYEGVLKTKKELYTHVRAKKGKLFVNADDAVLTDSLSDYAHCITYGQEKGDLKGKIEASAPHITIRWSSNGGTTYTVKTQLFGSYNLTNVLAALCIGSYFDVEPAHMNQALAAYVPANNRSQVVHTKLNTVILDAYNANPSSMKLALESFATMKGAKVAILGDMLELGAESQAEHQQIADLANELAIDQVLLVGKEFAKASKHSRQLHFENQEALSSWLKEQSLAEKQILIKGSRGIALEKALPAIP